MTVQILILILRNYLRNCPRIIFAFDHLFQNSKIKLKNDPFKSKITKCQKTDPSQIFPLIPKQLSEFSKLKNQIKKLPLKIKKPKKSFKSQNVRKLISPNMPILITKQHWEGPRGPPRWPKTTSPPQELEGGLRSGPNF